MADDLKRVGLIFKADGAVDFQKSLKEVNATIQENRSEFQLVQSQYDENTKSMDKLADKQKYLQKQTDAYKEKLVMLKGQLKELEEAETKNAEKIAQKREKLEAVKGTVESYKEKCDKLRTELASLEAAEDGNESAIKKKRAELEKAEKNYVDYSDKAEKLEEDIEKLNEKEASNAAALSKKRTQVNQVKSSLANYEKGLKETSDELKKGTANIKDYTKKLDEFSNKADSASDKLSGISKAAAGVAAATVALVPATEEYRQMQSKLEGSAQTFGYSVEFAKSKYEEFYKYLGDDQVATNAITNLMGIGTSVENVSALAEGATAAWASYGDSIQIEPLTESINETINAGKVTGAFADTINWCKDANTQLQAALGGNQEALKAYNSALAEGETAEDAFNEALAKITNEQERANVVAAFLNNTYGTSKKIYDETASSILNANESTASLKEETARLAETVSPFVADMTGLIADLLGMFNDLPAGTQMAIGGIVLLVASLSALLGAVSKISSGASAVIKIAGNVPGVMSTVGTGAKALWGILMANPAVLVIAAIAAIIAILVTLYQNCEEFREGVNAIGTFIADVFTKKIPGAFNTTLDFVKNNWQGILLLIVNPFAGAFKLLYDNCDSFRNKVDTWIGDIKDFFSGLKDYLLNIFKFKWSLPRIELPHFKATGKFSLNPLQVPRIGIEWYAKGGIINKPTAIGMNGSDVMVGGEAGSEAIIPIAVLKKYIREELQLNNVALTELFTEALSKVTLTAENNIYIGDKKISATLTKMVLTKLEEMMNDNKAVKGALA